MGYDYLILSPDSQSNTFRTPSAAEHALFMRELGDALAVRDHIIASFERGSTSTDRALQRDPTSPRGRP